jgi:hypothetical protein
LTLLLLLLLLPACAALQVSQPASLHSQPLISAIAVQRCVEQQQHQQQLANTAKH